MTKNIYLAQDISIMPNGKKEDKPYVDGVTVKITEKYKRPPRIKLPVICQSISQEPVILEEYDFRLERSVLSKMEEWKKAREVEVQRREERRKLLQEQDEAEKRKEPSPTDIKEMRETTASPPAEGILTPVSAVRSVQPLTSKPISANFNLSEFESDNSSPFDNMELKTINDLEILASVLATNNDAACGNGDKNTSHSMINNNIIPNKNGVVWNKWDGSQMYSSLQSFNPASYPTGYPTVFSSAMYSQQPRQPIIAQQHSIYGHHDALAYQVSPYYHTTTASSPAHQYHVDAGGTAPNKEEASTNLQSHKSNSKSVPDLVLELEAELKEKRFLDEQRRKTKTPPLRPSALTSTSAGLEDWKPWPELESPRHSGPDAIETLSLEEQKLARNFSEMGFAASRIVRTMRHFKGDDKKVIEFLLQVQRIEEKNYSGDLVERALHANNYEEEKTICHLNATLVLRDLGFNADEIERTLLETDNDINAALERLIS